MEATAFIWNRKVESMKIQYRKSLMGTLTGAAIVALVLTGGGAHAAPRPQLADDLSPSQQLELDYSEQAAAGLVSMCSANGNGFVLHQVWTGQSWCTGP
ncbi:MAG TPA: hypothetical protein VNJ54_20635 [Plantibacter sp.]|uniref:hypothetical protein n=1 Tax=unclassified Plantibacter TaxID=2624265 RepID=UPI002C074DE7|nr:hypothetical protein [Plantibacter sp.]